MQPSPSESPRRGGEPSSESVTLSALARDSLARCDGDTDAASEAMIETLSNDRGLWRTIASEAVSSASREAVQAQHRAERKSIVRAMQMPPQDAEAGRRRVAALAEVNMRCGLDFPLKGGVKLRDATRDEVMEQAQLYDRAANDMTIKARWLYLIANRVPEGVSVGSVLSSDAVETMYREAIDA